MELEKIATELAQKAVAARHSDTRLKPGEYPEWAYEFRKLAQEHYADLAMTKQAEEPAAPAPDYNPYSMYDKAVAPGGFMANPIVRNALVTGGLGAGVGALGSLASNLFSRKRKKRYLSDALSAGLLGGLAGGVGGAGYTALTDSKANTDFTGKLLSSLGMDSATAPPKNPAATGHEAEVIAAGKELNPNAANLQKGLLGTTALGLTARPAAGFMKDLASGKLTSQADTAKMLSNINARAGEFRQTLKDPAAQKLFDAWIDKQKLINSGGNVDITHQRQLSNALRNLSELESGLVGGKPVIDPATGQPIKARVDTSSFLKSLIGDKSAPGIVQSFNNQDLVSQRLNRMAKGRNISGSDVANFLDKAYKPQTAGVGAPFGKAPPPRSRTFTNYRGGLTRGPGGYGLGLAGLSAIGAGALPWLQNNTDARGQAMSEYINNLRSTVSNPGESAALTDIQNRYAGPLEASEVRKAFGDLGAAGFLGGAGK